LQEYTQSGAKGEPVSDVATKALPILREKLEVARGMLHGFDYSDFETEGHLLLPHAADHLLGLPADSKGRTGKERFGECIQSLSKAYTLCGAHPEALVYRDEIAFLEAINATVNKSQTMDAKSNRTGREEVIRQLISRAVASDGVQDLFAAVGLKRPNIGVLSEAFLKEVRELQHKNVAVELLERLLRDEIRQRAANNLVQNRKFSEKLRATLALYHNRAIETAQVIEELIAMAREFNAAARRGEELHLSADEVAFYDALEANESAVRELGDETLRRIALELTNSLRQNVSVDWAVRENVRAKLRLLVRRVLRKYKYPPDYEQKAIDLVLQQAEALSSQWTA